MNFVILPSARLAAGQDTGEGRALELFFKRTLDILAASLGILLIFPVCLIVALAVKLDSPGPVFYAQERVGINRRRRPTGNPPDNDRRKADCFGRPFTIYKFRSMVTDAERSTGPVWASACDSRVTRVGKFLRHSRLDETPQLWNVLRGEMSLVGPRPDLPRKRQPQTPVRSLLPQERPHPARSENHGSHREGHGPGRGRPLGPRSPSA